MTEILSAGEVQSGEFDLIPDPRVLPMLGEINLELWRCIAELADNSIDGFLHAARAGSPIVAPRVEVTLPVAENERATVRLLDNGPGMIPDVLQKAVSAGWSGNNPVDNLGLFGMGFNIATARMGTMTEVWTTREGDAEWHGVRIDFDELRKQRTFRAPHLTKPKSDPAQHGTEIVIGRLKPEQRAWLARSSNHGVIRKMLSQAYSAMLRPNGEPLSFQLFVNNKIVQQRRHCVWDKDRVVTLSDIGDVPAVIYFNFALASRVNCGHCMAWLPGDTDLTEPCPFCGTQGSLVCRGRNIRGWIGLQRHLDKVEFGFDFVRNGRKIEIANKDLFVWRQEDVEEPEYPIDDQRGRGRFVGEIHVDHCRVDYAKQRFDRNDPAWSEMVRLIRGEGPLRPEKAKEAGFGPNDSPLFKLFKAFRRTSPQSSQAGAWKRILIVRDNDRALAMARQFHDGDPEYQSDAKWWELIQEADTDALFGTGGRSTGGAAASGGVTAGGTQEPALPIGLFDDPPEAGWSSGPAQNGAGLTVPEPPKPARRQIHSLSRRYDLPSAGASWSVEAYESASGDPALSDSLAWSLKIYDTATRTYHFIYDVNHEVFKSITLTPQDALMTELAWQATEMLRGGPSELPLGSLIADFRKSYIASENLDPRQMAGDAGNALVTIANLVIDNCPAEERGDLFNGLTLEEQQEIMRSLAARNIRPDTAISDGSFLRYPPFHILPRLLERRPELFFDGKIWEEPYEALDYRDPTLTNAARTDVRERYRSRVADAVWLSQLDGATPGRATREELIRALMSIRLLKPDVEPA